MSPDTPLISNLNMCENIALIKEVRENMSIREASALANKSLGLVGLEGIANQRVDSCSKEELFLVMFIRALMTHSKNVIIESPSNILGDLSNIEKVARDMKKVNLSKKILILDFESYKKYYEGCGCNMIK